MAKNRKSTEYLAQQTLIGDLLSSAQGYANNTGCSLVIQSVGALARLETVKPDQVEQTIALVDAQMDLSKRFANICKAERDQTAAESENYETGDEVEEGHARPYTGTQEQGELVKLRVYLVGVFNQLTSKQSPSILRDMIPVPGGVSGGDRPQGRGGEQGYAGREGR